MTSDQKTAITQKTDRKLTLQRACTGLVSAVKSPIKGLILVLYIVGLVIGWKHRDNVFLFSGVPLLSSMLHDLTVWSLAFAAMMGLMLLLVCFGTPFGVESVSDALRRSGLTNSLGETPTLISKQKMGSAGVIAWKFDSSGIPRYVWEAKKEELEVALDISIISIRYSKGKKSIIIEAVPAKGDLPDLAIWSDTLLSPDNFVLVLGEGMVGPVSLDLSTTPHVLIGGGTGSGKTILLMNLLRQAHCKGAEIYLADAKYGVDFPGEKWKQMCRMAFSDDAILEMLGDLVSELETRRDILRTSGYPNIDSYNEGAGQSYPRIIFACDEVAELLDKTGRTKEQKELTDKIIGRMETIARQGRACNINLMLATQRPDAQTMPGHIKNNLSARICGKADQVLSQIVLDTTDAATLIPKDARGRFLYGDVLFQAYWMEEKDR